MCESTRAPLKQLQVDAVQTVVIRERRFTRGGFLAGLVAIPVLLLRPVLVVRLVRFHPAFGNVLRSPLYYLLKRERENLVKSRRHLDFAFWVGDTPTDTLARFWRRQIRIVQDPIPRFFPTILNVISWYWLRNSRMSDHVVSFTSPHDMASELINSRTFSAERMLDEREKRDVQDCLTSLGVMPSQPIALIHIRSADHDLLSSSEFDSRCANADPKTFQKSVDFLKSLGFAVISVGNPPSSPSYLDGVIEYHRSSLRTPLRDLTLGSVASLFIGTAVGAPTGLPLLFRLPFLSTNHQIGNSNVTAEPLSYGRTVLLPKNMRTTNGLLTHGECLRKGLPNSDRVLAELGVTAEDNEAEDILAGLKELLELGDHEEAWAKERKSPNQQAFYEIFDSNTTLPRVCRDESAIISPSFLRKFPHWLK